MDAADFDAFRKLGEKPKIPVCEGTYQENVNIPPGKRVHIQGAGSGMTIVNRVPGTPGPVFFADNADKVNISDLTVDGQGGGIGVYLNGADGSTVEKIKVWDVDTGFRVENIEGGEIKGNLVNGATSYGAELVQSGDGVLQGIDIMKNRFYDTGHDGAVVRGSNSDFITGITFSNNWFEQTGACGISLFHGTGTTVKKNWFKDIGVHAMHVAGASFNTFVGNAAWDVGGNGISMEMGTWNHFTKNTIRGVEENGILAQDGWNYFTKNEITGSGMSGIKNEATAEENTYEKNTVRGSGQFDAWDESADGGTAGTASVWTKNKCETDMPDGLCKSKAKPKKK